MKRSRKIWEVEARYTASYHAQTGEASFAASMGRAPTNSLIDQDTKLLPFQIVSIDFQFRYNHLQFQFLRYTTIMLQRHADCLRRRLNEVTTRSGSSACLVEKDNPY